MRFFSATPDSPSTLEKLFEGFQFATRCDAWMAAIVTGWIKTASDFCPHQDEPFRPPLVLISGPRGCGKKTLALRMAEYGAETGAYILRQLYECPIESGELSIVAAERAPAVLFDCSGPLHDPLTLEGWLLADKWPVRVMGQETASQIPLATVSMLTTESAKLPPELEGLAVHIRLLSRETSSVGVKP